MYTRLTPIDELKEIFAKGLFNNTDKVSKISDESVINGIAFGASSVAQRALKDQALVESKLFVDSASGSGLDDIAASRGIAARLGILGSSTWVLLVGVVGSFYEAGVVTFTGSHGITFELEEDFNIPISGYGYAKVRSIDTGKNTNVDPLTITQLVNSVTGHNYVINEYQAIGGRDLEDDDTFKKRIKEESLNILAQDTISKITQVFININSNILRVIFNGMSNLGNVVLGIITQNGAALSDTELDELLQKSEKYFAFSDFRKVGSSSGIILENLGFELIDFDFRVELLSNYDPDDIRLNIQLQISKYLDFRFWDDTQKVEWDDILQIVKNIDGVKYVPDNQFNPSADITISTNLLPRARGFIMRNLEGDLIADNQGNLDPVYYPNTVEDNYQNTVLQVIS